MDYGLIFDNIPTIMGVIIMPVVMFWLGKKFPSLAEKTGEFAEITDELKEMKNEYKGQNKDLKKENKEIREENSGMKNDIEMLKKDVEFLKSYETRYNKLRVWAKDACKISKNNNVDLPHMDPEVWNDIQNR